VVSKFKKKSFKKNLLLHCKAEINNN